jgi:protein-L-isoaspartate(D-aspartate) O-methyltransferase
MKFRKNKQSCISLKPANGFSGCAKESSNPPQPSGILNGFLSILVSISFLTFLLVLSCSSRNRETTEFYKIHQDPWKDKAEQMVNTQIAARGVSDPAVLRAMKNTPRHLFVPDESSHLAYNDHPLPIGFNQTISQPYIVGLMTELLELSGQEIVLEIGTGSGYQASILSQLVSKCYSIEVVEELADKSKKTLSDLGYDNVTVKWGDGYQGWPEHAPFDAIIVTAAPEEIPEKLIEQLKTGGKMVIPVGKFYQELLLITKKEKGFKQKQIIPVRFVPMIHPYEQ